MKHSQNILKYFIIIFCVVIVCLSLFLNYKVSHIRKHSLLKDKKAILAYYFANEGHKFFYTIYTKIYPQTINQSLTMSIQKGNVKAIDYIIKKIDNVHYRDQTGTSSIGLLSTLINLPINEGDNAYNLNGELLSNNPSKNVYSIGINYLNQFKIPNSDDSYASKIHSSNSMVNSLKLIKIPGISKATYNPSILPFEDGYILVFRLDTVHKYMNVSNENIYISEIGITKLDSEFNIIGDTQILSDNIDGCPDRCSAEDPRLIRVADKIYMVYNRGELISSESNQHSRKMYLSEIDYNNKKFVIKNTIPLISPYPFLNVERNWVPFTKDNELFFIYSVEPNLLVLKPNLQTGISEIVKDIYFDSKNQFGQIKGGTPLFEIEKNKYLGFFHSNIYNGIKRIYYIIPAIFNASDEKYEFDSILSYPLFLDLYSFPPELVVSLLFPAGISIEKNNIIISVGKNDGEILIIRIDKDKMLKELDNNKKVALE